MSDWKFDVDDVGEDGEDGELDDSDDGPEPDAGGDSRPPSPLEPGDPSLEGAIFVVFGVAFAIWVGSMLL